MLLKRKEPSKYKGTSINCRERLEYKADGAQNPAYSLIELAVSNCDEGEIIWGKNEKETSQQKRTCDTFLKPLEIHFNRAN